MCIELQPAMLRCGGVRTTRVDVHRLLRSTFQFEPMRIGLYVAHSTYEHLLQQVRAAVGASGAATLTFFAVGRDNGGRNQPMTPYHYDDFFPPDHPHAIVPMCLSCVLFDPRVPS